MRGHIYMSTKMSFDFPSPFPKMFGGQQSLQELDEMWVEEQEALIKEIKPEIELDFYSWEPPLPDEPHEEMRHHLKLWYLIAVLKKTGISLDQVGDNMGLTFLGNVIYQFKRHQQLSCYPGSCNYVCFLYNYFQKVSSIDWPAKNAILGKLTKRLPKMVQTRNKAKKSFNEWWLEANTPPLNRSCL